MVLLAPEQRVADQEILDFGATVVEHQRAPVGVFALARIGVLVKSGAVEFGQPVNVFREVSRHPVYDHSDSVLMAEVHEVHEVFRSTVTTRGSEVADSLIAPTTRERMLGNRHQFDVGEVHL